MYRHEKLDQEITGLTLKEIRELGFPYFEYEPEIDDKLFNELKGKPLSKLVKENVILGSSRFSRLANAFFPRRYEVKVADKPLSAVHEFYNNDRILGMAVKWTHKYSAKKTMREVRHNLSCINGIQIPSNFKPEAAKVIYELYGKGGKVFDYSAGWGGRLVGFLASSCNEYVGIDVESSNFPCYDKLVGVFNRDKKVSMLCYPSEAFCPASFHDYFDISFSSPPYFSKEEYSASEYQSHTRFDTYNSWLTGFLLNTILNSVEMLKIGGHFAINVSDFKIKSVCYPLVNDASSLCGMLPNLKYVAKYDMRYAARPGVNENAENKVSRPTKQSPILVYEKVK